MRMPTRTYFVQNTSHLQLEPLAMRKAQCTYYVNVRSSLKQTMYPSIYTVINHYLNKIYSWGIFLVFLNSQFQLAILTIQLSAATQQHSFQFYEKIIAIFAESMVDVTVRMFSWQIYVGMYSILSSFIPTES